MASIYPRPSDSPGANFWIAFYHRPGFEEHAVAQEARNCPVGRAEAAAHPPLRIVGQVLGVVAPEGAVVVPEVMVGVLSPDPDGGFCFHWWFRFGFPPGIAGTKKPPSFIRAVVNQFRGEFVVQALACTSSCFRRTATVRFLHSSVGTLTRPRGHRNS